MLCQLLTMALIWLQGIFYRDLMFWTLLNDQGDGIENFHTQRSNG